MPDKKKALDSLMGTGSSLAVTPEDIDPKEQALDSLMGGAPASPAKFNVEVSRDTNPDTYVKQRQTAEDTGISVEAVEAAPEAPEKQQRSNALDSLLGDAPSTQRFLERIDNAKAAHDAVKELTYIEGLGNGLRRGGGRIKQGVNTYIAEEQAEQTLDVNRSFQEILEDQDPGLPNSLIPNIPSPLDLLLASERYLTSRTFGEDSAGAKQHFMASGRAAKYIQSLPMSDDAARFRESIISSSGFLETITALVSDPAGISAFVTEVGIESIPMLLAGTAATMATKSPAAGATVMGFASGLTERYSGPAEFLQALKIDLTDPKQVTDLLANPELMEAAKEYGFTRGAIIGAVDAISGGFAGKALAANPAVNLLIQMPVQSLLAGTGEASAQLATKGELDMNEVIFEAIGELATAPFEVAGVGGQALFTSDKVRGLVADNNAATADEIAEALQASPLTERSPEQAAEHAAGVLREQGIDRIFIPFEDLVEVAEAQEDAATLYSDLGVADQMEQAELFNGDVTVTPEAYSQYVLQDPDMQKAFRDVVRYDEEGLSVRDKEAQEEDAALEAAGEEVSRETTEAPVTREEGFNRLADGQRHKPELAMLDVQKASDGGVLSHVVEHVGDISHRMSEKFDYLEGSLDTVKDKVEKTLRTLRRDYGFEREYKENITNNARYRGVDEADFIEGIDTALAKYAEEHEALDVYNEPQQWARDAAVALGKKDWQGAIENLEKLETLLQHPEAYKEAVSAFDPVYQSPEAVETEQAVELAEHEAGMKSLFDNANDVGLNETQYASYVEAVKQGNVESVKRKIRARYNRLKKKLTARYEQVRTDIESQEKERIASEPLYQAELAIGRDRLDQSAVLEIFGGNKEMLKALPKVNGRNIYAPISEAGISPDIHADVYGMDDGAAMLFQFIDNPSFEEAIQIRTEARVEQEFPTLVSHRQNIKEGLAALHNDKVADMMTFELARIREKTNQGKLKPALIRAKATELLKSTPLSGINTRALEGKQRKEASKARKAVRAGDWEAAAKAQLNRMMAFHMAKQAYGVKAKAVKDLRYLKKVSKNPGKKKAKQALPVDFKEGIQQVLARYHIGPETEVKDLDNWIARVDKLGVSVEIPESIKDADNVDIADLTLGAWNDLVKTVKTIQHEGNAFNKTRRASDKQTVQEIADTIVEGVTANIMGRPATPSKDVNVAEDVKITETALDMVLDAKDKFNAEISGILLNVTTLLRTIDNFVELGPAYTNIKGRVDKAITSGYHEGQRGYLRRLKAESEKLTPILEMFSKTEVNMMWRQQDIPGVRARLSHRERLGVLQYMGSAGGIEALLLRKDLNGNPQFTEQELQAIVDHASKRDLDFVQAIWDNYQTFWPEIEATVRRRQNRVPEKIEALVLDTPHGQYRGGYSPLVYDNKRGILEGEAFVEDALTHMKQGGFINGVTRDGYTKTREGSGGRPLLLDPFVISNHVQQVVYDLEVGDAVADVYKIWHNKRLKHAFEDAGKIRTWDAVDLWLDNVVTGEIHRGGFIESAFRHLRTGTTIASLGFNLNVAMLQPLGLIQSANYLGKANMVAAVGTLFNPSSFKGSSVDNIFKWVTAQTGFMQEREQSFQKDIHDAMRGLRHGMLSRVTPGNTADYIATALFVFTAKAQRLVDTITWIAAKKKGVAEGMDQSKSNDFADLAVERAQGSGLFHTRTAVERGTISKKISNTETVRGFSLFLNYFATKLNVAYERTAKTNFKNPLELINWAVDIGMLFVVEGLLASFIREGISDDEEELTAEALTKRAFLEGGKALLSGVPYLREVTAAAEGFPTGGAVGSFVAKVANAGEQIAQGDMDEAAVKAISSVAGILLKAPSGQINKSGSAIYRSQWNGDDIEFIEFIMGPKYVD